VDRTIIHLDMDAFFASIEVRDNPELSGKPLIIGALPTERGVVSTCSYEARKFGIHSAMSIKEAYRRCPGGIYMHGDMRKYEKASKQIHQIMLKYTDMIEFVALDEGYMDVTHSLRLFGSAEQIGRSLKAEILEKVGVTCSVGISYSKMSAKLASEEMKPDGFFVIPDRQALINLIQKRDVGVISGIGAKTQRKLNQMGIVTVEDLLNTPPQKLESFGAVGREILKLAMGNDDRPVVADSISKSIGREYTFQTDVADKKILEETLLVLARDVSLRAKKQGLWGRTVTIKIKFSDMQSITRSKSGDAINSARDIFDTAKELLKREKLGKTVRLVGVTLSNLQDFQDSEFRQLSIFDELEHEKNDAKEKIKALDDTIFEIHTRYGRNILKTGKELEVQQKTRKTED